MKTNTIILSMVMIISGSCSQQKPVDKTVLGIGTDYVYFPETLTGKIKELRETNYWAVEKDGKITKGTPLSWHDLDSVGSTKNLVAYFDGKGTLTRYDLVDENNIIRNSSIGKVENGKITRWDFKTKDSTTQYLIPEYNTRGYMTGGKIYHPAADTLLTRFAISYDDKGNYTKIEYFNSRNMKGSYQVFSINELGKVKETKFFNKFDTLSLTFTNTYNEKGFLATQSVIAERPKRSEKWEVQDLLFDDHGNWLQGYSDINQGKFRLLAERTYIYY